MQFFHSVQQPARPGGEANAPTRHGVSLGDPVHGQGALSQTRLHLGQGVKGSAVKYQVLVDVVREDQYARMLQQHLSQCVQFFSAVHGTGGVGRRVENQPAGVRPNGCAQGRCGQLEAAVGAAGDNARAAAAQLHHLRVADPVRGRNNDLIAVIEGGGQCIEDHLLTTAADLCVLPTDRQTILDPVLVRNGLAQSTQTGHWGIARVACVDSRDGRLADVLRSIEIRLARTQGKNTVTLIAALGDPVHDAVSG